MNPFLILLAVAVAVATTAVDYAHARYVQALVAGRQHAAARWSVAQWAATSVGFVVAVKYSLLILPAEAVGLYVGTLLGSREVRRVASG